jgi:hypothetical protein
VLGVAAVHGTHGSVLLTDILLCFAGSAPEIDSSWRGGRIATKSAARYVYLAASDSSRKSILLSGRSYFLCSFACGSSLQSLLLGRMLVGQLLCLLLVLLLDLLGLGIAGPLLRHALMLLNNSERRLGRTLLLMADFGNAEGPRTLIPPVTQETLAEMIGTTRSRVSFFMNRFRKLGYCSYKSRSRIHQSLLTMLLEDQLPEQNASCPKLLAPRSIRVQGTRRTKF